jgi:phosphoglycolate phosphatase
MITLKHNDWELSGIEAIIFDKDGTLTDVHTYWGEIIKMRADRIVNEFCLPSTYKIYLEYMMGYSTVTNKLSKNGPIALVGRNEVIRIVTEYLCKNSIKTTEDRIGKIFDSVHAQFAKEKMDECIKILPKVREFLVALSDYPCFDEVLLFLLTSDTKTNAKKGMIKLDLIKYFTAIYGKEDSKKDKITGSICGDIIKTHELNPENVIAIGDTNTDIIMAKNAGIKGCIGVATGQVPFTKLETPYKCHSFSEIKVIKE